MTSGLQISIQAKLGQLTLDVAFSTPSQGVTALFGRSGTGKTTILRAVAGLQRFADARIHCHGESWQDGRHFVPPHQRAIGYVFQEASLFPHLSVRQNLEYGWHRAPRTAPPMDFTETCRLLGVDTLLQQQPHHLSGGQRQRVAMARALLAQPRLLLMDEPLASLDQQSKADILPYLERLFMELRIPVLYVSHTPAEVIRLAQSLVLLEKGKVRASGPLDQLLTDPALPFIHLDDACAVLPATVASHDPDYHLTYLSVPGGRVGVSLIDKPIGQAVRLAIHARDVSLALQPPAQSSILNQLAATVTALIPDRDPAQILVSLNLADTRLLARITRRSAMLLGITPGQPLLALVKSVALMAEPASLPLNSDTSDNNAL